MFNATRAYELLVGLPDVNVLDVVEPMVGRLEVTVESIVITPICVGCGERAWVKDRPVVELVDLTCFGRPVTLRWRKHRLCCPRPWCSQGSWTHEDPRIAAPRLSVTDRAGRWATVQVGQRGRAVSDVAAELGADWHAVNDAVMAYGQALLEADVDRVGQVEALGVEEVLFARLGRWRTQAWSTSIVDVASGQLLDVIEGRSAAGLCQWLTTMGEARCDAIRWAVLDLSGPWRLAFNTMVPDAVQIADPFHLVKLANQRLDEVRRRVQQETLGHRGHKDDPLYRSRRLLTKADERLDDRGRTKLLGLLDAGDPRGEVRTAWHAKETVRGIYDVDPDIASEYVTRLGHDLQDDDCPPEIRQLGRTIVRWADQIAAWHQARVSNGPTEAINNLIKRVKRVAFGFRQFANYRIRALLYAGRPNWTYSPRSHPAETRSALLAWQVDQQEMQATARNAWVELDIVASTARGNPIDRHAYARSLRGLCADCGIEPSITPYELRHTAITMQADAGHTSWEIADWAGTSEQMISEVYRHRLHRLARLKPPT